MKSTIEVTNLLYSSSSCVRYFTGEKGIPYPGYPTKMSESEVKDGSSARDKRGSFLGKGPIKFLAAVISDGKKPGTAKLEWNFPVSPLFYLISILTGKS